MPAKLPAPHLPPNETDDTRAEQEILGSAIPEFTTLALRSEWRPAYEWAVKNDVLDELLLVANAAYLKEEYRSIGRLLEVISSNVAISLLDAWAPHEEAAQYLYQLSQAALRSPDIYKAYPPLSTSKPAARQLAGKLETNYLLALIIEKVTSEEAADPVWLESLKVWVITHAVHRALNNNYQDNWLRQVSTQLRKACHQSPEWREPFLLLKSGTADFSELSRNIAYKAERLIDQGHKHQRSSDHRQLLHAMVNVADRRFAEDSAPTSSSNIIPLPRRKAVKSSASPMFSGTEASQDESNTGSARGEWLPAQEETGEDIFGADVNSKKSLAHQKLQGNSIILYCTEELQYLPYSWGKPNFIELDRIHDWLKKSHATGSSATKLIAAIAHLALSLGRTLKRTLDIEITTTLGREWGLNPETLELCRIPPRREPGWKPSTQEQHDWITTPATQQIVHLPREIAKTLRDRIEQLQSPRTIGDLWDRNWGESAEQLYAKEFANFAPRVTAGMLANVLPQQIFEETGDSTFTRLLSSHPKSALPGSCAYSSWSTQDIAKALGNDSSSAPGVDNAMGSLLDPVEFRLHQSIHNATQELAILSRDGDVIVFHNAYVAYLATGIFAATGERPINDPVETIRHFDFEQQFLYISDKVSNELRQARLVPLPSQLCDSIQNGYAQHLLLISRKLAVHSPQLARDISELVEGKVPAHMPFLFFLTKDGQSWESVTEKGIAQTKLFDWPLPLNHFRHRLARKLRQHHLDTEIIDAILGHAEVGSATHGDYSFRTWMKDMQLARPALETSYAALGFSAISPWTGIHTAFDGKQAASHPAIGAQLFGAAARERDRRKRFASSVKDARIQIQRFTHGRNIAELNEDELNALSTELLFHQNGMPHPNGYIKYRILLKRIEREWRKHGKKARVSHRYQITETERSPYNEHAPGAITKYTRLNLLSSAISTSNLSRLPTGDLAIIAALLLCVESRITNIRLLQDILEAKNFRIVSMRGSLYLEHAEGLNNKFDNVPIRRFQISGKVAQYLDLLLSKRRINQTNTIPKSLCEISTCVLGLSATGSEHNSIGLIQGTATLIDQVNVMTFPGIVAGYLAGRVETYSLFWNDWARLELGQTIQIPDQKVADNSASTADLRAAPISAVATIPSLKVLDTELLQTAAFKYLKGIEDIIRAPENTDKGTATENRKVIARKIQHIIDEHAGKISTPLLLLGKWTIALLFRKSKGRFIQLSSIDRYLSALKLGFIEVGYDLDILACDEEDITDFYCSLFEAIDVNNTRYVAERLGDFHGWARDQYAISDPDWNELPAVATTVRVSPGAISEKEYQKALSLLAHAPNLENDLQLAAAFLLVLCYRFALRGNDALGLERFDIAIEQDNMFVYVQNNRYRKLKTITSRRQVPLLFRLSNIEKSILKQTLAKHEGEHGSDVSAPLFFDLRDKSGLAKSNRVKRIAIEALKTATSDSHVSLHHARHSAANAVGLTLAAAYVPKGGKFPNTYDTPIQVNVEQTLLGRHGMTRRMLWAASRFLGHARRQTTCQNYLHFLGDFADAHVAIKTLPEPPELSNVVAIDELPRSAGIDTTLLELHKEIYGLPKASDLLKLMRLIARGASTVDAAQSLRINPCYATKLESLLEAIGNRIRFSKSKFDIEDSSPIHRLIRRIKEPAWNRMIAGIAGCERHLDDVQMPAISTNEIPEMIGSSRQILIWEMAHVELMKSLISFLNLSRNDYELITALGNASRLRDLLDQHELQHTSLSEVKKQKKFQIDTIYIDDGKFRVEDRGAFAICENNSKTVRNSVELLTVFLAFSISNQSQ